jgi:hypothetical protein
MSSDSKTNLQRDILITWYDNPNATNKEIAEACDCSASYVSEVKNRFDGYNEMEAMFDREDRELERMFGDGVLGASSNNTTPSGDQKGLAETYDDLPDNAVGTIVRVVILLVLVYVVYEVGSILFLTAI